MDTFVMLLFALIVVVIALVFLSKLLYDKYVQKGSVSADGTAATAAAVTGTTTAAGLSASVVGIGGGALLPGGAASREGSRLSEPKEVLASKKVSDKFGNAKTLAM